MDPLNKNFLNPSPQKKPEGGEGKEVQKKDTLNLKEIKTPIIPPLPSKEEVPSQKPFISKSLTALAPQTKKGEKKNEKKPSRIKSLRTYQDDIARSIKKDNVSIIKMALAEQGNEIRSKKEAPKKNMVLISISTALIIGGILAPTIFFFINKEKTTIIKQELDTHQFISTESLEEIDTTGKNSAEVLGIVKHYIKRVDLRLGDTRGIYFTEEVGGQKRLLQKDGLFVLWETRAPNSLIRSLNNNFMLGAHAFKGNEGFLILKTNFYENSFAGMLDWETYLARDIFNIFGVDIYTRNEAILSQKFQDIIVKNRDARAIKDASGNIILIYSFPDRKTIVIAESSQTLNDIITKLNTQRVK